MNERNPGAEPAHSRARSRIADFLIRIGIATIIGGIVGACAVNSGVKSNWHVRRPQMHTQSQLRRLGEAIEDYQQKKGKLPGELSALPDLARMVQVGRDGIARDDWDHPYHYEVLGSNYTLRSLGRDGKPGGIGLACDLLAGEKLPPEGRPTYQDYFEHSESRGLVFAGRSAGALTFLFTLWMLHGQKFRRQEALGLILSLVITLLGAVVVSWILMVLHVPTGH